MTLRAPRVFLASRPLRRGSDGKLVPSVDLEPVKSFGELIVMLDEGQSVTANPEHTLAKIRRVMAEQDFRDSDFILLAGLPVLMGWSAMVAAERVKTLRTLQWTNKGNKFIPVSVQLDPIA